MRDAGGNLVSSGGSYDPSTKKITIGYNWPGGTTTTFSFLLARYRDNAFDQTDWSGGGGVGGAVTTTNSQFASSTNINTSGTTGSFYIANLTSGALSFIQVGSTTIGSSGSPSSSSTASFTSGNTAGDLIVVEINYPSASVTVTGVTDTAGNTYTQVGSVQSFVETDSVVWPAYIYYAKNIVGGANSVTAQLSGNVTTDAVHHFQVSLFEFSGLSKTSPLDTYAAASSSVSGTASAGPVTTASANELLFAYLGCSVASDSGGGWITASTLDKDLYQYMVATTAGPYTYTGICNSPWLAEVVAFKK